MISTVIAHSVEERKCRERASFLGMGRENTAERKHAREIDCTSILGNKNEFPFINQSVSTSAAGLALWHYVESRQVYDFILAPKRTKLMRGIWGCLIYIIYCPN